MRPGYLAGYRAMIPKRYGFAGGKADIDLPPKPPPPGQKAVPYKIEHAYDKQSKNYYMQDPRCEEGDRQQPCEKVKKKVSGCNTNACCDIVAGPPFCLPDCDPPGTLTECDTDPNYVAFPEKDWKTCDEVKKGFRASGIPEKFALPICKELKPKPAPKAASKAPSKAPLKGPSKPQSKALPPPIIKRPKGIVEQIMQMINQVMGKK